MSSNTPTTTTNAPFTHVLVVMRADAFPLVSQVIEANEVRNSNENMVFVRDERVVFQARTRDVAQLEHHTSHQDAQRALDERRATHGRGGLHIQELSPPTGGARSNDTRARGGPAEGIGFRVNEDR